ncbi:MAG TPA: 50S ribosomal protein L11 [Candidatus Paceibacterota bacterium]|nr:50S ribosomal protein L11 [Candidatus Paceibacterota bacterium]
MAKKVQKIIKVQATGGQAKPAPPLGPTLGQAGINIGEFINKFNTETRDRMGEVVPTIITVYADRSFSLEYKTAPATALILKAIKKDKGSGQNMTTKVGTITKAQIREIAEKKMVDLNANDINGAIKIIEGSCRSMGVDVK